MDIDLFKRDRLDDCTRCHYVRFEHYSRDARSFTQSVS